MSRPTLAVLAFAALLAAEAGAQSPADAPLAQSTFASGTDGWISVKLPYPSAVPPTVLGSFTPTWIAGLGGYIRLEDPDGSGTSGQAQYWSAPASFLGLKSAAYGGSLEFDLANTGSGFTTFNQEDILLLGGGLTLVHALGGFPVPSFTHYSIPLSETGWTVGAIAGPAATAQQMQAALASIEHLYIRAEYQNGPDTEFLDNVTLQTGPGAGTWTNLGFGLAGVSGVPGLAGTGTLVAGSAGSLALGNARPASPAILFISFTSSPTPFKGGTLVPVPVALSLGLGTDGVGGLLLPFVWPAGLPAGTQLYFQYAIQDVAGPKGASLSNALLAITP